MKHTPCRNNPWFTTDKPSADLIQELKAICNTCPVQQECLDTAIENKEESGIWGGLTLSERAKYAFERNTK